MQHGRLVHKTFNIQSKKKTESNVCMNFIESKKGFPFVLNRSLFLKKFKGKEEKIYVYNTQRRKLSHHVPQKII